MTTAAAQTRLVNLRDKHKVDGKSITGIDLLIPSIVEEIFGRYQKKVTM
jgi:hypothetical protein